MEGLSVAQQQCVLLAIAREVCRDEGVPWGGDGHTLQTLWADEGDKILALQEEAKAREASQQLRRRYRPAGG